jgi:hypothetical protein
VFVFPDLQSHPLGHREMVIAGTGMIVAVELFAGDIAVAIVVPPAFAFGGNMIGSEFVKE